MKNKFFLISILVAIFANFAIAEIEYPVPSDILKISQEISSEQYADADEVLVSDVQNIHYNPDGTGENIDDVYLKILTEKGKNDNRTINFHFNSHYQKIELLSAELIKSDGSLIPIDISANSRVSVNHNQMSANIYDPNQKIMTLNIPALAIGDIIHYRSKEITLKTRMPNTWQEYFSLQYDQPILSYQIEVRAPKSLPIAKIAIKDEVENTINYEVKEKENETIHRWIVKNVPQVFPEPDMPPLHTQVQRLLLGTVSSWEDISKWYWNLCLPRLEKTTPEMEEEVKKLCENKKTTDEKIRSIFDFVSQKIRYMGITTEEEAPGYEPHDVCVTFENRYGVCRDKAALLTAMLRIAGLKAYPVLIMAGPKKDPEVPNPYFNHAITCVENENGEYILMDATGETQTELLPAELSDKSYLVAKANGDTLRVSPIIPAEKNILAINSVCEIRKDKSAFVKTRIEFNGINDTAYRGAFLRRSPEQIKDFMETVLRHSCSQYRVQSFETFPTDLSDTNQKLIINLNFLVSNIYAEGENSQTLLLPLLSENFGMANFLIDKMGLEERCFPLFTEIACGVTEEINVNWDDDSVPPAFFFPEPRIIDLPAMKWQQQYQMEKTSIKYLSEFILKKTEFSPDEYNNLKSGLGARKSDLNSFPIATKNKTNEEKTKQGSAESGIKIISENVEIEIFDQHSWQENKTIKATLLDFSGKREISEMKLHFNEGITELSVEYAKVISADGKVKEIRKEEINLMDQGWSSQAPRYPPGKILVLSFPGVDIGSTIEFKIVSKHSKRPFFEYVDNLRGFYKIGNKKISIKNPNKIKINYAERIADNLREGQIDDGNFSYTDLARLRKENDIPPAWANGDCLILTSGDWEKYCSYLKNKISKIIKERGEKLKQITSLIKEQYGDEKKLITRAIRDFTALYIRQAGPAFYDLPADYQTNLEQILGEGYANSFDTAALIAALLSENGIEYELVLTTNFPYIKDALQLAKKYPRTSLFNQILVKAKIADEYFYLNDTNQYAELGTVANEGNLGLSIDKGEFFNIKSLKNLENAEYQSFLIKIKEDGSAEIKLISEFYGMSYAKNKKQILEMTPELLKRHFQEQASQIMISAKLIGTPITQFDNYPGKIEFTILCPDFAKIANGKISFQLPNRLKVLENLLVSRENPYILRSKMFMSSKYIVSIPPAFSEPEIAPPKEFIFQFNEDNFIKISSELKENHRTIDFFGKEKKFLICEFSARLSGAIFSAEQYQKLLGETSVFNAKRNSLVIFRKDDIVK